MVGLMVTGTLNLDEMNMDGSTDRHTDCCIVRLILADERIDGYV